MDCAATAVAEALSVASRGFHLSLGVAEGISRRLVGLGNRPPVQSAKSAKRGFWHFWHFLREVLLLDFGLQSVEIADHFAPLGLIEYEMLGRPPV